jgi:hypothetical protein
MRLYGLAISALATRADGVSSRTLGENLVHLLTNMLAARRLQVAHRALHVGMAEPLLDCPQIDSCPQTPRREGRSKLMQPEILWIEFRAFRHGFQAVEEIELWVAS